MNSNIILVAILTFCVSVVMWIIFTIRDIKQETENNKKAYDFYKSTCTESKDIICLKAKSLFSKMDISELNLTEEDMINVTRERIMKSLIEQLDNYNCFDYEFITNPDESTTVALTLYAVGNKK